MQAFCVLKDQDKRAVYDISPHPVFFPEHRRAENPWDSCLVLYVVAMTAAGSTLTAVDLALRGYSEQHSLAYQQYSLSFMSLSSLRDERRET